MGPATRFSHRSPVPTWINSLGIGGLVTSLARLQREHRIGYTELMHGVSYHLTIVRLFRGNTERSRNTFYSPRFLTSKGSLHLCVRKSGRNLVHGSSRGIEIWQSEPQTLKILGITSGERANVPSIYRALLVTLWFPTGCGGKSHRK